MLTLFKAFFSNIGTLIALLNLIPTLETLIMQVEKPGLTGAQKKANVLTILQDTLSFATGPLKLKLPTATIMAWATTVIDTLVTILNQAGVLLPSTTSTPVGLGPVAAPAPVVAVNPAPIPVVENNTFDVMAGKPGVI